MANKLILNLEKVRKSYFQGEREIEILKGLDLRVPQGAKVAIVGESGSGKSTLLSLIAGLDTPSEGSIAINGQEINLMNQKQLTEFRGQNLGIIFQQYHLMTHLTALENVQLPLEILGHTNSKERARKALKLVKLEHRHQHLPQQLSGGENQRVAIARSLVVQPKLLLADEPSGSLDHRTGEVTMDLLFDAVRDQDMTMVLVTHSLQLARQCDEVWELQDGQLVNRHR